MKQYIDKSALVAWIENQIDSLERNSGCSGIFGETQMAVYDKLYSFLESLEVKEVDLGQEIKNGIDNLCNLYCYMEDLFDGKEEEGVYPIPEKVTNELFEFAKHFFELGIKAKGE